jgi:signal transduction histidine kinase
MTTSSRALDVPPWRVFLACAAVSLSILVIDVRVDRNFALGIPQIAVVLVALIARRTWVSIAAASLATLSLAVGDVLSPAEARGDVAIANRVLAASAVWITALAVVASRRGARSRWRRSQIARPSAPGLLAAERQARVRAETLAAELRTELDARHRFLATLSHELRTPLAPIASAVELLRTRSAEYPEEARRLHALIARQVQHLARLTDDLFDIARIRHRTLELRLEELDVAEVVDEVVEANRGSIEPQHQLSVAIGARPLRVAGDRTRLHQILSNLLINAQRYTPAGGRIAVLLESEAGSAVIRLRDSGIGIERGLLSRVFEPFVQAEPLPGQLRQGLGLGLSLVKQLTELHGGSVAARSDGPRRGSEFIVRLPLLPTGGSGPSGGQSPA